MLVDKTLPTLFNINPEITVVDKRVVVVMFVLNILGIVEVDAIIFAVEMEVLAKSVLVVMFVLNIFAIVAVDVFIEPALTNPLAVILPLDTRMFPFVIFKVPDKLRVPELILV